MEDNLIGRLLNSKDPTRDLKLAAFGVTVIVTICWLTREQWRGPITDQWVDGLKWLLLATGLGGAAWTAADKWKGKSDDPPAA